MRLQRLQRQRLRQSGSAYLVSLVFLAGACVTSSGAGGGDGGDAGTARGTGGGAGGGAGGAGVTSCSVTPSGCFCQRGGDVGALIACSAASVAGGAGQQGSCCEDATGFCKCDAYECKNNASAQDCECGTAFTVESDVPSGAVAAECPAPSGNQKCCLSADSGICLCSLLDCESATAVATCSVARVAACPADQQSVASCK